jgi:hypothetical protein
LVGRRPDRCQPRRPWKSLTPPGRRTGTTCSRSGAELAAAPRVAGSSRPRLIASSARQARPLPISKRREPMSLCGTRSPARWRIGPRTIAASLDPLAAPTAAPVATWSETITLTQSYQLRQRHRTLCGLPSGNHPRTVLKLGIQIASSRRRQAWVRSRTDPPG